MIVLPERPAINSSTSTPSKYIYQIHEFDGEFTIMVEVEEITKEGIWPFRRKVKSKTYVKASINGRPMITTGYRYRRISPPHLPMKTIGEALDQIYRWQIGRTVHKLKNF